MYTLDDIVSGIRCIMIRRVLAFDPAISLAGFAIVDYDDDKNTFTVPYYGVINGDTFFSRKDPLTKEFSRSFCILEKYELHIKDMVNLYKPDLIVCESAFAYKFVAALISLTLVIHTIRRASRYELGKDISTLAPQEVKRLLADYRIERTKIKGIKTKDLTASVVLTHPNIQIVENEQYPLNEEIPSHITDAIGIGVSYFLREYDL